jgi:hypothetical protein
MTRTEEIQMNNPPEGCKPFNLERALAGDPVVMRDGRPVTQITKFDIYGRRALHGVVEGHVISWFENGRYYSSGESSYDLLMAPKKRTVWVNMYGDGWRCYWYDSEEEADNNAMQYRTGNRAYPVEIEE